MRKERQGPSASGERAVSPGHGGQLLQISPRGNGAQIMPFYGDISFPMKAKSSVLVNIFIGFDILFGTFI